MVRSDPNPYASPTAERKEPGPDDTVESRPLRWRLIPAALFLILGAIAVAIGLFITSMTIFFSLVEEEPPPIPEMLAACGLYLGAGAAWLTASRFFWVRRYRAAVAAVLIGCLIPAVVFSIFGM